MKIDYKVPFYSNTPDDTHCLQAAFKSILKYFAPERDYSWTELDKATAKVEDMWTWPMAGLIWMKRQGFDVKNIEEFDYQKLIDKKGDYLVEKYGQDTAATQILNSDIEQEIKFARDFVKLVDTQNRPAELEDILGYLKDGYIIGVNVNYKSMNNQPGYVGHFVLVKGVNGDSLIIHDPGLPPVENRLIDFGQFDKGWAYPSAKERNIMAFKK